jgi:hypothetical protein
LVPHDRHPHSPINDDKESHNRMSASDNTAEDPFAILGETLETAADSMEETKARARGSARRAAAATKRVVGSGSYSASYGLAYGIVWMGTYLHDLLPTGGSIQRGFDDGSHDAIAARNRRRALREEEAEVEDADPESPPAAAAPRKAPARTKAAPAKAAASAKRERVSAKTRAAVDKRADDFEDHS